MRLKAVLIGLSSALLLVGTAQAQTKLLWGDTHLHTNLSADAYINRNTTADLDAAYRFAKGMPVIDAVSRAKIKIDTPLDFLAVTDHAEYAGLALKLFTKDPEVSNTTSGARFLKMIQDGKVLEMFIKGPE